MARSQLRVLQALDFAKAQWHRFTTVVTAGMGFFTDAYGLFTISLVTDLLGRLYYDDGKLPTRVSAAINGSAFCGAVLGQLFFGWLGDKMSWKRIYNVILTLMATCSMASGSSFGCRTAKSVLTILCFFRFWLGFSIGGDYPLTATILSEYSCKKTRGAFIAAVFAMQGLGNLAAGIVGIIVSASFKNALQAQADYVWRIILMFGTIPVVLTYYWRTKMPETAGITVRTTRDAGQAASNMATVLSTNVLPEQEEYAIFSIEFLVRHGLHLLGATVCWLVLDVAFYSLNLFMKDIFTEIGWFDDVSKASPLAQTYQIAVTQTLVSLCGALPGYFFTFAFIEKVGRIRIQLLGFVMMTLFTLGLAISYQHWTNTTKKDIGFVVMYAFILFFANFGPNSTTFILPAEIFPARLRSTCHGISGAGGKVGAIIGVLGFLFNKQGIHHWLIMLVACNVIGLAFTFILPESKLNFEISREMEEVEVSEEAVTVTAA